VERNFGCRVLNVSKCLTKTFEIMMKNLLVLLCFIGFGKLCAQAPVATVQSGTTTFCVGGSVVLHSSIASGNRWYKNGNALAAYGQDYTATSAGSYTVKANGLTSNAINVTVIQTPTITPAGTSNVIQICEGGSIVLSAPSYPGANYLWSTGETTRSITVATESTFWVEVSNSAGCSERSVTKTTVFVTQPSALTITANGPTTFCRGGSVVLQASAANAYRWFRNGVALNTFSSTYTATLSGSYTVKSTSGTCYSAASNTINVTANALPTATVNPTPVVTISSGSDATLTSSYAGTGGSYLWSNGQTTRTINTSAPGQYTVRVTNNKGCSKLSSATTVNVLANQPTVTADGPLTFCAGGSVVLTSSDAAAYLWSTGETTKSITVTSSGNYSVTITDNNGYQNTSTATTVQVNALPAPALGPDQHIYIGYGAAVATLTSQATGNHLWSTAETTQSIQVSPSTQTMYTVEVTDNNGCVGSDTIYVDQVDVRCGKELDMVLVCHADSLGELHQICIAPSGVPAHLAHGCQLGECAAGSRYADPSIENDAAQLELSPNPFSGRATVSYSINSNSDVRIEVYSMLGTKVKTIVNSKQLKGSYEATLDLSDMSIQDGIYLLKFEVDGRSYVKRIIKSE
jgi:hypothetical protein